MRRPVPAILAAGCAAVAAVTLALAPSAALATPSASSAPATSSASSAPATSSASSAPAALTQAANQCMAASRTVSAAVPWAQQQLRPGTVWGLTEGAGQVVAVLDTGVSAAAPALSGALLPGLNVITGGPADTDCLGHGTFVAGIIAARPAAGSGLSGLAPLARILPVTVVGPNGSATSQAMAAGIRFAVRNGATVVAVTAARPPPASPALSAAVAYAVASDVVVIAPVGENQNDANQVSYPAAYPGVVAVSAVDSVASPISAGTPGVTVDLAAPGWNVASTGPRGPGPITGSGSSVATAFVAGTAALVRSYYPQLTAAQVVHRLEATADPPGTPLPDPEVGYGEVDPFTAVTMVLPEEFGMRAPAPAASRPLRLPPLPVVSRWPVTATYIACGAVTVLLIMALTAAHVIRHGRRRGWSPPPDGGGWRSPPRPRAGR